MKPPGRSAAAPPALDLPALVVGAAVLTVLSLLLGAGGAGGAELCQHNLQHTLANCSGLGLDRVPYGLHANIEMLDLSNNRFTSLAAADFRKYTNLRTLILRNNSITAVAEQSLRSLVNLRTLDLSTNLLGSIPTELTALPGLFSLVMAGNNLFLVGPAAFQGMDNLKSLDLSGNRIEELDPHALVGLPKLQVLTLANNALTSLHMTTFSQLPADILEVHLNNNPWVCDCKMSWMRQWMGNGTESVWQHPGQKIQCHGPSITRGKQVWEIPLDELACKVQMRTSGSTQYVDEGAEATMECIYFSKPYANPIWQRNEMPIDFDERPGKYRLITDGSPIITTRLHVQDFRYEDIAEYECLAQNVRGSDSTAFRVTLRGVPFNTVSQAPHAASASSGGVDTRTVVMVVAVVCGLILTVVLSVLVYCCVTYVRRQEQAKRDAVVENVKKHFLENGETTPSREVKDLGGGGGGGVMMSDKAKLDQFNGDDTNSDSNRTSDTIGTQGRGAPNEAPPYSSSSSNNRHSHYPYESPYDNGNTYVSFGSGTEPDMVPMYSHHPQANSTGRYEGSQTESTTPLLERYTPSVFDSDDHPFDDSRPIYDTATLYHIRRNHFPDVPGAMPMPPLTPGSVRSSTRSTTFIPAYSGRHPDYQDYRELRYPYNSTPQPRGMGGSKSMSVGNLGCPAPRKPPRIFHSREYVEMSPHDTSGSNSDYMSVPQHNSYYGIKPGTPV